MRCDCTETLVNRQTCPLSVIFGSSGQKVESENIDNLNVHSLQCKKLWVF